MVESCQMAEKNESNKWKGNEIKKVLSANPEFILCICAWWHDRIKVIWKNTPESQKCKPFLN